MLSRRALLMTVLSMLVLPGCPSVAPGFDVIVLDAGPDSHMDVAHSDAVDNGPMDILEMTSGCLPSQTMCGGRCTSTMIDTNNCGSCGHACGADQACYAGVCHTACPTGLSACGGGDGGTDLCVDLQDSRLNCGACDHVCPPQATCSAGTCILDCGTRTVCRPGATGDGGTSDAGGDAGGDPYCTDLTFDPANCGACGAACPPSYLCQAGACVIDCVYPQVGCPPDATHTQSFCSNHNTDPMNCGTCGHTCPTGQTCTGGTCVCMAPQLACGASCVDPRTDNANCGTCGHACTAGQYCTAGSCVLCAPRTLCSPTSCIDTNTDATNCGSCGHVCPVGNVCQAGACICPTGSAVCGGVCSNLASDSMNCGMCGHVCPAGQFCVSTVCSTNITTYTAATLPSSVVWVDACSLPGAMTGVQSGVDDGSGPTIPIPFSFRYFDGIYTSVTSHADGYLLFGASTTFTYGAFSLPSASAPNPALFIYSRDLYQRTGNCFGTIGTAPNRTFIWEENDAYVYFDSTTHLTWEVMLNEGTNTIDVIYQTMTGSAGSPADGSNANVGGQNVGGTRSFVYEYLRAGSISPGLRIRFVPG